MSQKAIIVTQNYALVDLTSSKSWRKSMETCFQEVADNKIKTILSLISVFG